MAPAHLLSGPRPVDAHRVLALLVVAILGCNDADPSSADLFDEPDAIATIEVHDRELAAQPMPAAAQRVDAVLRELGRDAGRVGQIVGSMTTANSREVLVAIGPKARASLRRHNVRVSQLARHLRGGAR